VSIIAQKQVPEGHKQSEVGLIPDDWDTPMLGSVCSLVNGRGFKPFEWSDQGLPIIRIQNLNGSEEFNYYDGHYDPKIFVEHNQLLFAWSGSRGTSFGPHIWKGRDALLNYHTWKLVIDISKIESDFFYHALKVLTKMIEDSAHGASALVHTQKGEMEKFYFPVPSKKEEQTAIANALSDVDALIGSLEKLIAKKCAIKTAAMQQLLTGKKRLPPFDQTHTGYKQTDLGEIPNDWEVGTIGDSTELITKGTTPMTIGRSFVQSGVTFVKVESVSESGMFDKSKFAYIDSVTDQLMARSRISEGDLLISIAGALGRAIIATKEILPANTNQALAIVRFKKTAKLSASFVYHYTKSKLFTKHIEATSSQGAQPNLSLGDIANFPIILADKEEQSAIANVLSDMDKDIDAFEQRLNKTQQLKQGMMQELLTGRTRLI